MKCFICKKSSTVNEKIIQFENDEKLKKCQRILNFRKMKQFKYSDLNLDFDNFSESGYHLSCYRKFTPIPAKYKEEFNQMEQTVSKELYIINVTSCISMY